MSEGGNVRLPLTTSGQKAFILGPLVPCRVSLLSMTPGSMPVGGLEVKI